MASLRHVPIKCRGPHLLAVIYQHLAALGTLDEADTHVVTVNNSHVRSQWRRQGVISSWFHSLSLL
ncbi:hypothetical protein P3574_25045, partial [Vibrio parahaemolyticus]|nr:hypothetical protein [Vibrio parahaemolyticus]